MFADMADIDKGMDVFDVNGEKIGTVDEIYSGQPGETTNRPASTGAGGGVGALGDESRVSQAPGHGGRGALGDETRAGTTPPGGGGALGNEGMVGNGGGATQTGGADLPGAASGQDEVVVVAEAVAIPVSGETSASGSGERYFKVDQGGILGLGAKSLYIPFSAVQNVAAGDRVTVDCAKDECDARYGSMPATLQQ